jgi:hypothetical protein
MGLKPSQLPLVTASFNTLNKRNQNVKSERCMQWNASVLQMCFFLLQFLYVIGFDVHILQIKTDVTKLIILCVRQCIEQQLFFNFVTYSSLEKCFK